MFEKKKRLTYLLTNNKPLFVFLAITMSLNLTDLTSSNFTHIGPHYHSHIGIYLSPLDQLDREQCFFCFHQDIGCKGDRKILRLSKLGDDTMAIIKVTLVWSIWIAYLYILDSREGVEMRKCCFTAPIYLHQD